MTIPPQMITLDVRGEICPEPLYQAMEAMQGAAEGQQIELLTDFPPAVLVVTSAAVREGWDVHVQRTALREWRLLLTLSPLATSPP